MDGKHVLTATSVFHVYILFKVKVILVSLTNLSVVVFDQCDLDLDEPYVKYYTVCLEKGATISWGYGYNNVYWTQL